MTVRKKRKKKTSVASSGRPRVADVPGNAVAAPSERNSSVRSRNALTDARDPRHSVCPRMRHRAPGQRGLGGGLARCSRNRPDRQGLRGSQRPRDPSPGLPLPFPSESARGRCRIPAMKMSPISRRWPLPGSVNPSGWGENCVLGVRCSVLFLSVAELGSLSILPHLCEKII